MIYQGPDAENSIYLFHHYDHYDLIDSMKMFLGRTRALWLHCDAGVEPSVEASSEDAFLSRLVVELAVMLALQAFDRGKL